MLDLLVFSLLFTYLFCSFVVHVAVDAVDHQRNEKAHEEVNLLHFQPVEHVVEVNLVILDHCLGRVREAWLEREP